MFQKKLLKKIGIEYEEATAKYAKIELQDGTVYEFVLPKVQFVKGKGISTPFGMYQILPVTKPAVTGEDKLGKNTKKVA